VPSLKSHLVALYLRHTRKKAFASPANLNEWIARARLTQSHRPPPAIAARLDISERRLEGWPVYEILPRGIAPGRLVYLHGGAYCFEITSYHWDLIAELAERLAVQVTVPVYPLAPEHGYDDIFGFGRALYADVMATTPSKEVAVVGDSAGGNMAVVLEMMAAERGLPLPARQVLISPSLDMTLARDAALERRDPWLGIPGGLEAIRLYAGDMDRADWRISPAYGDLSILPPTLILAGGRDLLTPGTMQFAQRAGKAGADVTLAIEPNMFHVWPLIDMPEARAARDRIVAWLGEWRDGLREARPPREAFS